MDELFDLIVKITLDTLGLKKGAKDATGLLDQFRKYAEKSSEDSSNSFLKIAGSFSKVGLEALGFIAIIAGGKKELDAFIGSMKEVDRLNAKLQINAQNSGTTVPKLSGLENVALQGGSTKDAADSAVSGIFNSLSNFALTGQPNETVAALIKMGIKPIDDQGKPRDTTDIVSDISKFFQGHSMAADQVYGQSLGLDPTLINALKNTPDVAGQIESQSSVTDEEAQQGRNLVKSEGELAASINRLESDIASDLTPLFIDLINVLTVITEALDAPVRALNKLSSELGSTPLQTLADPTGALGEFIGGKIRGMFDNSAPGGPSPGAPMGAEIPSPAAGPQAGAAPLYNPATAKNIDPALTPDRVAAQEVAESGGRQTDSSGRPITSSTGAIGLMQIEPSTAAQIARDHGFTLDQAKYKSDPGYNRMLGELYMSDLMKQFKGNYFAALAAYNAGPNGAGVKHFAQTGDASQMPAQTQNYVSEIRGYLQYLSDRRDGKADQIPAYEKQRYEKMAAISDQLSNGSTNSGGLPNNQESIAQAAAAGAKISAAPLMAAAKKTATAPSQAVPGGIPNADTAAASNVSQASKIMTAQKQVAAAQNTTHNNKNVASTVNVGPVTVNTQAKTGKAAAAGFANGVQNSLVLQAQRGINT